MQYHMSIFYFLTEAILLSLSVLETNLGVVGQFNFNNPMYKQDVVSADDAGAGVDWIHSGDPPPAPAPDPPSSNEWNQQNQPINFGAQTFQDQVQGFPGQQGQGIPGQQGQGFPGQQGQGSLGQQGQGSPGQQGQGFPRQQGQGFPGQQGQANPGLQGQGNPGLQGQGNPGLQDQAFPGQQVQGFSGQPSLGDPSNQGHGPKMHHHRHHGHGRQNPHEMQAGNPHQANNQNPHHQPKQEVVVEDSLQQRPSFDFNGKNMWDWEEEEHQKQQALSKKMHEMGISKGNENYPYLGEGGEVRPPQATHIRREELSSPNNPQGLHGLQERPKDFYKGKIVHDPNTALILQQFNERKNAEMLNEQKRRQQQRQQQQNQPGKIQKVEYPQSQSHSRSHRLEDPPEEIRYKERWYDDEDDANAGTSLFQGVRVEIILSKLLITNVFLSFLLI